MKLLASYYNTVQWRIDLGLDKQFDQEISLMTNNVQTF